MTGTCSREGTRQNPRTNEGRGDKQSTKKEFRAMTLKMTQEREKRMDEKLQDAFQQRKYKAQPELKNTITEMKITLEEIHAVRQVVG